MQYRKKPVVIEAVRWDGRNVDEVNDFLGDGQDDELQEGQRILLEVHGGEAFADVDDWIVKDAFGEIYPCRPDIFAATYDPV